LGGGTIQKTAMAVIVRLGDPRHHVGLAGLIRLGRCL
jgi:hypothetical protein